MTFVDTSALLAFLDRDAASHQGVVAAMTWLLSKRQAVTHNYAVLETEALTRRRLGTAVARRLLEDVAPVMDVVWVDVDLHRVAVTGLLAAPRRRASLVDHVSFELMRRRGLRTALALDRDFEREGFELIAST